MSFFPSFTITKEEQKEFDPVIFSQRLGLNFAFDCSDAGSFFENSSCQILLLGELLQYQEVRISSGINLFDKVVADILGGELNPNNLNGHFGLVIINFDKKIIKVITNRLGTFHVYYRVGKGISTSFNNLSKTDLNFNLDKKAITYFIKYGFFVNNSTYHEKIKLVQPSSIMIFDFDFELQEESQYYTWEYQPKEITFQQSLNEYSSLLTEVVEDIASGVKLNVPVSGGLDSRETFAIASQISSRLSFFSYGLFKGNQETSIAGQLAAKRKVSLYRHQTSNYLFSRINDILSAVEGYHYLDGTRQIDISDWLFEHGERVLAAHAGDIWNDQMGVGDEKSEVADLVDKKFKKKGYQKALKVLGVEDNMPNPFVEQSSLFLRMANGDVDFAVKMMKMYQWSHRWTMASIRAYQLGAFPRLPFYDNRIVDFFMKTPFSHVSNRRLQIENLKKFHPDLARVRWQEFGASLFVYRYWNNRNLLYRIGSKIWRTFFLKEFSRNWELFFLNEDSQKKMYGWASTNKELKDFVSYFYRQPDGGNGYALSMLFTVDQAIKFHSGKKASISDVGRK